MIDGHCMYDWLYLELAGSPPPCPCCVITLVALAVVTKWCMCVFTTALSHLCMCHISLPNEYITITPGQSNLHSFPTTSGLLHAHTVSKFENLDLFQPTGFDCETVLQCSQPRPCSFMHLKVRCSQPRPCASCTQRCWTHNVPSPGPV